MNENDEIFVDRRIVGKSMELSQPNPNNHVNRSDEVCGVEIDWIIEDDFIEIEIPE